MFEKEVYIQRRARLKEKVERGVILILGNNESPMNYPDNTYHFRQDSTFLYFFGIDYPGLAGVIDVDSGKEMIFGDDVSIENIIWMGPQRSMADRAAEVGITETQPFGKLSPFIEEAANTGRKIHFTPPYRGDNIMLLSDLTGYHHNKVKSKSSVELIKACVDLRSVKDAGEIEELERHMKVGYEMHTTAMKMAQPGNTEQQVTGILEGISMSGGGMVSFPIICSVHGETLHNHYHGNTLKESDLLLVDAGSESPRHYATDHTRTSPVGGEFTQKQKEIYQIVVDANDRSREATLPGVPYRDAHMVACKTIAAGLKELGLMKGDVDEAVAAGAHALFFPHGLGHMLGLDVHDMEDYDQVYVGYDDEIRPSDQFGLAYLRLGRRLQPGFVITNEPGIYFIPALIDQWRSEKKHEQFINYDKVEEYKDFGGIRLEDDILVTENGCQILGERIPIYPDEVEKMVRSGK